MTKNAVYAIIKLDTEDHLAFRVGQPVDETTAYARWDRLDLRRIAGRRQSIRHNRRWYTPEFFEVRSTDEHGRGLGSERHSRAIPVPYRAIRVR